MLEEINEFDFENRIVSNEYDSTQDAEVENNLRPKTLNDYVGQEKAKSNRFFRNDFAFSLFPFAWGHTADLLEHLAEI